MTRRSVSAVLVAAAFVGVGWAVVDPAHAEGQPADAVTWSVGPADAAGPTGESWLDLDVDPGQTVDEYLYIKNLSSIQVVFALNAQDGYLTDKGRFNMLPSSATSIDSGTWIDVQDEVEVAAGATAIVPFSIHVPDNATPGDHAAGIAASVLRTGSAADGPNLTVESRVGFRVQTRVSGELAPAVTVGRTDAGYAMSWNPFSPGAVDVEYVVRNSGNARLDVTATASASGSTGAADAAEPTEMYPGDKRTFTGRVTQVWPLGFSVVSIDVDGAVAAGGDAEADDTAGTAPVSAHTEVVVWAMPWSQLLVLAALGLLLFAFLRGRRKRRAELERLLEEARLEGARSASESTPSGIR